MSTFLSILAEAISARSFCTGRINHTMAMQTRWRGRCLYGGTCLAFAALIMLRPDLQRLDSQAGRMTQIVNAAKAPSVQSSIGIVPTAAPATEDLSSSLQESENQDPATPAFPTSGQAQIPDAPSPPPLTEQPDAADPADFVFEPSERDISEWRSQLKATQYVIHNTHQAPAAFAAGVDFELLRGIKDVSLAGSTVLVVCAGRGEAVAAFARLGAWAIGTDVAPVGNVNLLVLPGSPEHLQYMANSLENVYLACGDGQTLDRAILQQVLRVLRPGGLLWAHQNAQPAPTGFLEVSWATATLGRISIFRKPGTPFEWGRGKKAEKVDPTFDREVRAATAALTSAYAKQQGSKLTENAQPIQLMDTLRVEPEIHARWKELQIPVAGRRVLCVGARLGGEVRAFTRLGALAVGIDFNPGPHNAMVLPGDAHHLQFASQTVDHVYCNVLDHIKEPAQFFKEVARILRPGGSLWLDVDQAEPDPWAVRDNRVFLRNGELNDICAEAGFIEVKRLRICNEKECAKFMLTFAPAMGGPTAAATHLTEHREQVQRRRDEALKAGENRFLTQSSRCNGCVQVTSAVSNPGNYHLQPAGANAGDKVYSDRKYSFIDLRDFRNVPYLQIPNSDREVKPNAIHFTMKASVAVDVFIIFVCTGHGNTHEEKRPWVLTEGWQLLRGLRAPITEVNGEPDEIRMKHFPAGSIIVIKGFNAASGKELNSSPFFFVRPGER